MEKWARKVKKISPVIRRVIYVCVCVCKTTQLRHVAIVVVDDFPVRFIHVVNLILQL